MCFRQNGYEDFTELLRVPKKQKIRYNVPSMPNNPIFERECNQEKVPFVECEANCCCDCTNMYTCKYVCSDLAKNGTCKRDI